MASLHYNCKVCQRLTIHLIRISIDNLPAYIKHLQCTICSKETIGLIDERLIDGDV